MKKLELTGKRFGRLTVIKQGPHQGKYVTWICRCDCGRKKTAIGARLNIGEIKSCGCFEKESRGQSQKIHGEGHKPTKEYRAWLGAKARCYNQNAPRYPFYGARGIRMSDEWLASYQTFLKDMGRAPPNTSLDRKDNNGHYCKENCRWASPKQQSRNQSRNVLVQMDDGTSITLAEYFEKQGIPYVKGYSAYWVKNRKR